MTSYPYWPRWTTDRQTRARAHAHTQRHSYTHTRVLSIYRHACVTESRGTALRHSLNMQQAILNKQEDWMERVRGVRGGESESERE